jgi:hypothetical protein
MSKLISGCSRFRDTRRKNMQFDADDRGMVIKNISSNKGYTKKVTMLHNGK